jgi:hypothetical protein
LRALRFSLVIESSGAIARFSVWPKRAELLECLQPKLDALRFPAFARGRRLANYTLPLRPSAVADATEAHEESLAFWFVAQLRGVGSPAVSERTPWWQNQNPLFVSVEATAKTPTITPEQTSLPAVTVGPDKRQPAAVSGEPAPPQAVPVQNPTTPASDQWWVPTAPQAN